MNHKNISAMLLLFTLCLFTQEHAGAQTKMANSVFGNGGVGIANSNHHIVSTIGQTVIGVASNSSNITEGGFWYQTADIVTSVEQISNTLPQEFRLEQNYPNPFNPSTTIEFALPEQVSVKLQIFDLLGREVVTLVDEDLQPGAYKVILDATSLSSGVYFYRIQAKEFVQVKKLTLLK